MASNTGDAVADAFLSGAEAPSAPQASVATGDPVADSFLASEASSTPPVEPGSKGTIKKGIFGIPYIDPKSIPTPKQVLPSGADSAMGVIADKAIHAVTGIPLEVAAGLTGIASLPWGTDTAARNIAKVTNLFPRANTDPKLQGPAAAAVQEGLENPYNPLNLPGTAVKGYELVANKLGVPTTVTQPVGRAVTDIGGAVLGLKGLEAVPEAEGGAAEAPTATADYGYTNRSGGAAAAEEDLSALHPELRQAVEQARSQGPVHSGVLEAHKEAYSLPLPAGEEPIRLPMGRATGDAQQFSDERNLRGDPATQGILSTAEAENNRKLVASMDEIRGNATPDTVHRTNLEHGQQAVTNIKTEQNARMDEIASNYKALTDANGGAVPVDTGAVIKNIEAKLSKNYLTKTAAGHSALSEITDALKTGEPISFEQFENMRSNLAEVQRGGGSEAKAASIIRQELEDLPLTKEAQGLKALANKARSSAKAMFDDREQNPAYEAVFNDNVPKVMGRHDLQAPSPLADSFMQRYVTGNGAGASRANILNLHRLMKDQPEFADAVQGATLNNLRSAAGISDQGGGFNSASYNRVRGALEPKADVLMSPETAEVTQRLGNVARRLNEQPKGSFVNNSATAIAQQRLQHQEAGGGFGSDIARLGANAAAGALGPAASIAHTAVSAAMRGRALRRAQAFQAEIDAEKLNFAQEATAPGAGLNYQPK